MMVDIDIALCENKCILGVMYDREVEGGASSGEISICEHLSRGACLPAPLLPPKLPPYPSACLVLGEGQGSTQEVDGRLLPPQSLYYHHSTKH